jgi:hypothetical protein
MNTKRIESKQATRLTWPDGSRAFVYDDGRWDLELPPGKHIRGSIAVADNPYEREIILDWFNRLSPEEIVQHAQAAVVAARNAWILETWNQGEPARMRRASGWLCPLT